MDAQQILTDEYDGEAQALLDALLDPRSASPPDHATVARLARLGIWRRGSILPRGTLWAAASVALPHPERLGELTALLRSSDPPVQGQVASALGQWGGETAVPPVAGLLRSSSDDTVRVYCVAALRTIGGPAAVAALVDAAGASSRVVAEAALKGLEALLTGGSIDDTSAAFSVREAPPEKVEAFEAQIEAIQRALEEIGREASSGPVQIKVRDLLELLLARASAPSVVRITPAKLDALLAELDALPATPLEQHVSGNEGKEMVAAEREGASNTGRPGANGLPFERLSPRVAADVSALLASARRQYRDHHFDQREPVGAQLAAAAQTDASGRGKPEDEYHVSFDDDGSLTVLLASHDLALDGVAYRVTVGDLWDDCVMKLVAKDQVLGEVKFVFDKWSTLPKMPPVRIERILAPS